MSAPHAVRWSLPLCLALLAAGCTPESATGPHPGAVQPGGVFAAAMAGDEEGALSAIQDTYLRSGAHNQVQGSLDFLRVRDAGDNRTLVQFSTTAIQSAIGTGTLVSATLRLTIDSTGNNWGHTGRSVDLHRLTVPWTEAGATWECAIDSNPANHATDCSGATQWAMDAPGPWDATMTATTVITSGQTGNVTFDVTGDVAAIAAGTATNNGWLVKKRDEDKSGRVDFASREAGATGPALILVVHPAPSWSSNASMPTGREWVSATASGGLLYAAGGYAGSSLATVEAYDPGTDSWATKAALPAGRYAGLGLTAIGGKLYLPGGYNSGTYPTAESSIYIYDTAADSWSSGAAMPVGGGCGASAAVGASVYVLTGCDSPSIYDSTLTRYDPGTNSWTALAPAPHMHVYPAMGSIGGKLYVIGGAKDMSNTVSAVLDVYDPATDTWSTLAPMPTARMSLTAQVAGGKLYVIGGDGPIGTASSAVEVYDPATNSWSSLAPTPTLRWDAGSAFLAGRIFVVGGTPDFFTYLNTLESLTP